MSKPAPQLIPRPPVVVIMGHIDHGKSTLLDYIRKSNVVATEAGGITQHISAYEVNHKTADGKESRITFLDTPGHAAFQGMRSRGARVADIAILVVSAEDGVKAQTIEAYKSIKTANIPFIVAINKIDRPNANIDRTKQSLAEADIFVEGYGGDIPVTPISAKTGEGVSELLDVLLLVAEMAELKGDSSKPAEGVVIEAHMDPKKGVSATLVILDGTLKKGMFVVAEDAMAPVRIMENFFGQSIDSATFSAPIRITGWSTIPQVGANVTGTETKKDAEALLEANKQSPVTPRIEITQEEGVTIIPIVLKSDVLGTLEAIEHELGKLTHERVKLKIVQTSVGTITENDVKHLVGAPGSPIVIGFHTKADALATDLAERHGVTIKLFDIIYKLTEWLEEEMSTRAPKFAAVEELGQLKVLRLFSHQKDRQVVGGRVESGKITKHSKVKIMRRDAEIGEGQVVELQHQKLKADEVGEGEECGVSVESTITIAERDILVPFMMVQK